MSEQLPDMGTGMSLRTEGEEDEVDGGRNQPQRREHFEFH